MIKLFSKLICFAVSLLVLTGMFFNAEAALVEMDLATSGDAFITLDTDTNLEWLDLTLTTGHSFDSVIDGYGGFIDLGFRYATRNDIVSLYNSAGIAPGVNQTGIYYSNTSNIINLLGRTYGNDTVNGSEGMFKASSDPDDVARIYIRVNHYADSADVSSIPTFDSWPSNQPLSGEGIFLVRDYNPVPIPAGIWLLGSGLVGLVAAMKRKEN
jgi:hypothetical protein